MCRTCLSGDRCTTEQRMQAVLGALGHNAPPLLIASAVHVCESLWKCLSFHLHPD